MSGTNHFLLVAVEKYNNSQDFGKVRFAEKDTNDLYKALVELGNDPAYISILINGHATGTAIVENLKRITERVREEDQIVFYFSGHGLNVGGRNMLVPADAIGDREDDTCIPIETLINILHKSLTTKNILFLDCCHSGIQAGEYTKHGIHDFGVDDLAFVYRKAEYCVGFASCKSGQKSYTHPTLENGVWTHFLVKALQGEADGSLYQNGFLVSGKLQNYLNRETYEFLQQNTDDKKVQTPIQFGSATGDFVIADINPVFAKKAAAKLAHQLKITGISMYIEEGGRVRDLDGYLKGKHFVPDKIGKNEDRFIKSISGDIAQDEISELSTLIRQKLRYKRREIDADYEEGFGWIKTPDFSYSISVSQSSKDASRYEVRKSLDNIKNAEIIYNASFNTIFDKYFDSFSFAFSSSLDVEEWIDKFEGMDLEVDYNPADPVKCTLHLDGLDTDIIITEESLDLFFTYSQSPTFLLAAFQKVTYQLEMHKIPLLT